MKTPTARGVRAPAGPPPRAEPRLSRSRRAVDPAWWGARVILALFLFVGALQLMKTGAGGLEVLKHGGLLVRNAGSTFGLGWLGALLVLSGSPVAASALTLVAAGSISEIEGFTMLTGSRLGAAFVVLLVAVIYALRGGEGERVKPVSTAVLALVTTAVIYIPGSVIGLALLGWRPFLDLDLRAPASFNDLIDVVYGPLLERVAEIPAVLLFLGGLGVLLLSFKLIDTVLPALSPESIEASRLSWLRRKWPMFGLGCLVALVTMSVSVALTVLVPLVAKRYVKREHILPYIMGANITTLGDSLFAAFVLQHPPEVHPAQIVIAGIVGTTVVSLFLLAFLYEPLRKGIWKFQKQMVKSKPRLAAFTAGLFAVPVGIILVSGLAG